MSTKYVESEALLSSIYIYTLNTYYFKLHSRSSSGYKVDLGEVCSVNICRPNNDNGVRDKNGGRYENGGRVDVYCMEVE